MKIRFHEKSSRIRLRIKELSNFFYIEKFLRVFYAIGLLEEGFITIEKLQKAVNQERIPTKSFM